MRDNFLVYAACFLAIAAGVYWLLSFLLMMGWNSAIVTMFSAKPITQWMAFWVIVILSIIGSCTSSK